MPSWAPAHSERGPEERAGLSMTPPKFIILSLISGPASVSGQSQCCTPQWLPCQWMSRSRQKPFTQFILCDTVKVMKRCSGNLPDTSCVSSDTASSLRAAWQRRHPKTNSSPNTAPCSQAQWSEAGGLLSPCQAACWETSGGTGRTTRTTCALWLMRLSAASTPGPSQRGKRLTVKATS